MSTGSQAPDAHAEDHAADAHATDEQAVDEHDGDEHGHDEPALGPVDVPAWAAAIGGVLIGVAVAFCFALATAPT
jgi:hypothetical protein